MRRVIDDTHLTEVADAVYEIIEEIDPADVSRYDYGMYRAMVSLVRQKILLELNRRFQDNVVTFGETTHAYGIGNNNEIELVFHTPAEQQICGRLCLINNMFGDVICFLKDVDRNRLEDYPSIKIRGREPSK